MKLPVSKPASQERALLCTVTGEPFQPVRLYYAGKDRAALTKIFKGLRCMDHDRRAGCWVWLYEHEAAPVTFGQPRDKIDPRAHPIVIGRFTFERAFVVLAVRSVARAVEAARFFGSRFGQATVLARGRLVNRWFEAQEAAAGLDRLDAMLDADVTVIDPADAEARFEKAMAGTRNEAEKLEALAVHREEQRRRDVPLVEDFPLHAEEETPEFRDLKFTLELRAVRAHEHWKGNTQVTLADLIYGLVERMQTSTP
jgi:hypothetical protein